MPRFLCRRLVASALSVTKDLDLLSDSACMGPAIKGLRSSIVRVDTVDGSLLPHEPITNTVATPAKRQHQPFNLRHSSKNSDEQSRQHFRAQVQDIEVPSGIEKSIVYVLVALPLVIRLPVLTPVSLDWHISSLTSPKKIFQLTKTSTGALKSIDNIVDLLCGCGENGPIFLLTSSSRTRSHPCSHLR